MDSGAAAECWRICFTVGSDVKFDEFCRTIKTYFETRYPHNVPSRVPVARILKFCLGRSAELTTRQVVDLASFQNFVEKFGPFPVCLSRAADNFFDKGAIVPWFHGTIGRDQAEAILRGKGSGSYLVRFSEAKKDKFTLVYIAADRTIKNCLISNCGEAGFGLESSSTSKGKGNDVYASFSDFLAQNTLILSIPVQSSLYESCLRDLIHEDSRSPFSSPSPPSDVRSPLLGYAGFEADAVTTGPELGLSQPRKNNEKRYGVPDETFPMIVQTANLVIGRTASDGDSPYSAFAALPSSGLPTPPLSKSVSYPMVVNDSPYGNFSPNLLSTPSSSDTNTDMLSPSPVALFGAKSLSLKSPPPPSGRLSMSLSSSSSSSLRDMKAMLDSCRQLAARGDSVQAREILNRVIAMESSLSSSSVSVGVDGDYAVRVTVSRADDDICLHVGIAYRYLGDLGLNDVESISSYLSCLGYFYRYTASIETKSFQPSNVVSSGRSIGEPMVFISPLQQHSSTECTGHLAHVHHQILTKLIAKREYDGDYLMSDYNDARREFVSLSTQVPLYNNVFEQALFHLSELSSDYSGQTSPTFSSIPDALVTRQSVCGMQQELVSSHPDFSLWLTNNCRQTIHDIEAKKDDDDHGSIDEGNLTELMIVCSKALVDHGRMLFGRQKSGTPPSSSNKTITRRRSMFNHSTPFNCFSLALILSRCTAQFEYEIRALFNIGSSCMLSPDPSVSSKDIVSAARYYRRSYLLDEMVVSSWGCLHKNDKTVPKSYRSNILISMTLAFKSMTAFRAARMCLEASLSIKRQSMSLGVSQDEHNVAIAKLRQQILKMEEEESKLK